MWLLSDRTGQPVSTILHEMIHAVAADDDSFLTARFSITGAISTNAVALPTSFNHSDRFLSATIADLAATPKRP
jgi:hypothetical protein